MGLIKHAVVAASVLAATTTASAGLAIHNYDWYQWDKQYQTENGQRFEHHLSTNTNLIDDGNVITGGTLWVWAMSDFNWASHEKIDSISIDGHVIATSLSRNSPEVSAHRLWLGSHQYRTNTRWLSIRFDLTDTLLNDVFSDSMAQIVVDFSDSVTALSSHYYSKIKLGFDYVAGTNTGTTDTGGPGISPVPLPAAAWLFLTALGGLAGARYRLRKPQ